MKIIKNTIAKSLSPILLGLGFFIMTINAALSQNAAVLDWVYQTYGYGENLGHGFGDLTVDKDDYIYKSGGLSSGVIDLDPDPHNEYLISPDPDSQFGLGYVAKYSSSGELIWVNELDLGPHLLTVDDNGNIYTSGEITHPTDFDPSTNEYIIEPDARELYLAKYDSQGNFLWAKSTETQGWSQVFTRDMAISVETNRLTVSGIFVGDVDMDPDENDSFLFSSIYPEAHAFVATYDLEGDFIWATDFNVQNMISPAREYQVKYDDDGGMFLSGQFLDTLQLDEFENIPPLVSTGIESDEYDAFLAKFNLMGNLEWITSIQGVERVASRDLTSQDGYIYLTGMLAGSAKFYSSLNSDSIEVVHQDLPRPFVAKYEKTTGAVQWAFDLEVTDNSWGGSDFITATNDGCYISGSIGGIKPVDFNPDPNNEHLITNNSGNQECFLAKYTSDGDFAWAFSTPGGVFTEPRGLQVLSNNNVVLAGSYRGDVDVSGYGSGDSISSYFTSSINYHVFMAVYQQGMLSTNAFSENNGEISLYPNPASDKQTVQLSGYEGKNVKITLYDIQGRSFGTLYEGKLEGENAVFEFDISHLSNGMYLYDVRMDTERKALRFIKQ